MGNNLDNLQKVKHRVIIWSAIPLLGIYQANWKHMFTEKLVHEYFYSNVIHDSQNIYKWRTWGTKRLIHLPKATELVSHRAKIHPNPTCLQLMNGETKCGILEHYSTMKLNDVVILASMWINFEDIMLRGRSHISYDSICVKWSEEANPWRQAVDEGLSEQRKG